MSNWQNHFALKPAAAMVAAAGTVTVVPLVPGFESWAAEAHGQKVNTRITDLLANPKFGLKYGLSEESKPEDFKDFNPAKQLGDRPYVLVFGFRECQFCNKIGGNLAQVRKYLDDHGKKDIPIVVVNTQPEKDRGELKKYIQEYKDAGVCGEKGYGDNFFIVFPKDRDQVKAIQSDAGAIFNKADPKSHGMKILVVDKGKVTAAEFGAVDGAKSQQLMDKLTGALDALPVPEKGRGRE